MGKKKKSRNLNMNRPLLIWLVAGAFSVALAAVVVMISTPAVQADVLLPRPLATAPPGLPPESVTPALLAPKLTAGSQGAYELHGIASWYGGVFNGRRTASGEVFDMYAMTACHPTLPFGTIVRVIDRDNKKSVVVRITDRGYLYTGRILDLSYGAAQKLFMVRAGIAHVDLEVISLGEPRHRKK